MLSTGLAGQNDTQLAGGLDHMVNNYICLNLALKLKSGIVMYQL